MFKNFNKLKEETGVSSTEYIVVVIFGLIVSYLFIPIVSKSFGFEYASYINDPLAKSVESLSAWQVLLLSPGLIIAGFAFVSISMAVFFGACFCIVMILKAILWPFVLVKSKLLNKTLTAGAEIELSKEWTSVNKDAGVLVGFRSWNVLANDQLASLTWNYVWDSALETASCRKCSIARIPGANCECGLYAWDLASLFKDNFINKYSRRGAIENILGQIVGKKVEIPGSLPEISAIVVGSGKAQIHSDENSIGWRSEHQQIIGFFNYDSEISESQALRVSAKYGVPFFRTEKEIKTVLLQLQKYTDTELPIKHLCDFLNLEEKIRGACE